MKSSIGIKKNISKLALALNILFATIFVIAIYFLFILSEHSTQQLVDAQGKLLVSSKLNELQTKQYRDFAECLRDNLKDYYIEINDGEDVPIKFGIQNNTSSSQCYIEKVPSSVNNPDFITVTLCKSHDFPFVMLLVVVLFYLVFLFLGFFVARNMERIFCLSFTDFLKENGVSFKGKTDNIYNIISKVTEIDDELKAAKQREIELTKSKAIADLLTQVVHDIRAPLDVLSTLFKDSQPLQDQKINLFKQAITRIQDLAESLLQMRKTHITTKSIDTVIAEIIEEKRVQYFDKFDIKLSFNNKISANDITVKIPEFIIKSIISNLIDNSFDALSNNSGDVIIELFKDMNNIIISIRDNGVGIPQDLIQKLTKEPITIKLNGNGLGIYNAAQELKKYNARLEINSKDNIGTTVRLVVPSIK